MSGVLKIGMTERTPKIRLSEANASDTWRPPTPYKIEFAKKVSNPLEKEKTLHVLLEQYTDRINPRREFFRVSKEEVRSFFDLMDGEIWVETPEEKEDEEEKSDDDEDEKSDEDLLVTAKIDRKKNKGCRDMKKCFTNGQRIRHTVGINKTWIATYDSSKNEIVHAGKFYKSLSGFAKAHYEIDRTDRCKEANGWKECQCEVDGKWISTYSLACIDKLQI
jgi:hypothetical protein